MIATVRRAAAPISLVLTLVAGAGLASHASAAGVSGTPAAGSAAAANVASSVVEAQAAPALVSFAPDQADRAESTYKRECEECHGKDLRGGLNGGPPLRGLAFESKYFDSLPASVLFGFMSSAMPPNAPGRYSPETYADLMAYILKWNGVQPGAPLPSDLDALDGLTMEK